LGIGLAIAASMVAIAEVACRIALGPEPFGDQSPIYASDPGCGFKVAANLRFDGFTTNRLGTRGAEPDAEARERILVLGDSMTLGAEVRDGETFCALLEEKLGKGCRVYNAGCPGYGPAEELAALRRLAPELRPTRVVVAFFDGNDFLDAGREDAFYRVIAGRLVTAKKYESTGAFQRLFDDALASTWSWGLVRAVRRLSSQHQENQPTHLDAGPVGMDAPQIRALTTLEDYSTAAAIGAPLVADGWRRLPELFRQIRDECASQGARLMVVNFPLPLVFDQGLRERIAGRWKIPVARIDAARPSRKVGIVLADLGIEAMDLGPYLRRDPAGAKLHLPSDLHYSPEGHRAVADALAQRLR
jgi:GDSL-like lipase/acylhydrolase family protein